MSTELVASNERLLDLVRYCRATLHEDGLITDQEFAELVMAGSESARRLETYDELKQEAANLRNETAEANLRRLEVEQLRDAAVKEANRRDQKCNEASVGLRVSYPATFKGSDHGEHSRTSGPNSSRRVGSRPVRRRLARAVHARRSSWMGRPVPHPRPLPAGAGPAEHAAFRAGDARSAQGTDPAHREGRDDLSHRWSYPETQEAVMSGATITCAGFLLGFAVVGVGGFIIETTPTDRYRPGRIKVGRWIVAAGAIIALGGTAAGVAFDLIAK